MNLILSTIGCNENENDFDDKGYKSEELGSSDPDVSGEERGPRYEKYRKEHMNANFKWKPRKLRIREVGEEGSRRRRKGVVYLCTKCSKPGHNAGSCKSKEQDPNRLKRKRKPPKGKGKEAANPTNPTAPANPTTQAAGVEASQVAEANPTAPVTQETVMVEASQVVDANPPDTSAVPDTNAPDQVGDTSAVPMDATHDEVVEASQVVDATHDQASQE
ncbi:hypothetical protein QL285_045255 [Trifolium repens]|nr:hypothetical protein QL285_045255 [Trifolium repens]